MQKGRIYQIDVSMLKTVVGNSLFVTATSSSNTLPLLRETRKVPSYGGVKGGRWELFRIKTKSAVARDGGTVVGGVE